MSARFYDARNDGHWYAVIREQADREGTDLRRWCGKLLAAKRHPEASRGLIRACRQTLRYSATTNAAFWVNWRRGWAHRGMVERGAVDLSAWDAAVHRYKMALSDPFRPSLPA